MLAEIYVVRHAQASFGAENYDQLSELGHQQSRWLGEYFADAQLSFDHVLRGDMVRHRETLAGVRAIMGAEACPHEEIMTGLNEFDFQALVKAYMHQHPARVPPKPLQAKDYYLLLRLALEAWSVDELGASSARTAKSKSVPLPESWNEFQQRVLQCYDHIQSQYSGKVLVVSSGGANAMLLAQVLQAPAQTMIELNLQTVNTSISHFYYNREALRLTRFNATPHLDNAERRPFMTHS